MVGHGINHPDRLSQRGPPKREYTQFDSHRISINHQSRRSTRPHQNPRIRSWCHDLSPRDLMVSLKPSRRGGRWLSYLGEKYATGSTLTTSQRGCETPARTWYEPDYFEARCGKAS